MIERAASDVLLNSFPTVGCEAWRASRQNFGGLCQFEKNMTFKLYQYVCWCIRERKRFALMENHSERDQGVIQREPTREVNLFIHNLLSGARMGSRHLPARKG